jgi:hypothetical protein
MGPLDICNPGLISRGVKLLQKPSARAFSAISLRHSELGANSLTESAAEENKGVNSMDNLLKVVSESSQILECQSFHQKYRGKQPPSLPQVHITIVFDSRYTIYINVILEFYL